MSVTLSFPDRDPELERLSKEATAARGAKDWPRAIAALRMADERMAGKPIGYGIEGWLRLPLFLAEAGRWDEAKIEFLRLLNDLRVLGPWEVPKWSQRGTIFDKMRLSLQRAGKPRAAVVACGLFVVCARFARSLAVREDPSEAEGMRGFDWCAWTRGHLEKALQKAKCMDQIDGVAAIVERECAAVSQRVPDLPGFSHTLSELVAAEENIFETDPHGSPERKSSP